MEISDAYMQERLSRMRGYVMVLLRKGPAYEAPLQRSATQKAIIWEHGRRNMRLQAEGAMALVGPVVGAGEIVGACVFTVDAAAARTLMDGDGAVQAGIFIYDVVSWFGAPGDGLPA